LNSQQNCSTGEEILLLYAKMSSVQIVTIDTGSWPAQTGAAFRAAFA
jgi:hypothetical protein